MFYKSVSIKEELCSGCGDCIIPCQKEHIQIINNKARISSENLCNKLGNCIPSCSNGAIFVEEIETMHENMPVSSEFEKQKTKAVL